MHTILSYRDNRPTNTQTGAITILASMQCNNVSVYSVLRNGRSAVQNYMNIQTINMKLSLTFI